RCQGSTALCDSRGQVYSLDERQLVAKPLLNADMGNYSSYLGSAERLPNGNYVFGSGGQSTAIGQSIEVRPDGTIVYVQEVSTPESRTYRVGDLYGGPNPALVSCNDPATCAVVTGTSPPAPTSTPAPATETATAPPTNTPITPPTNTPITPPSS